MVSTSVWTCARTAIRLGVTRWPCPRNSSKKSGNVLRKGLCPSCGEPKEFCKCKSSMKIAAGTHTIRTHNNKHLRKAKETVTAKEAAYKAGSITNWLSSRYLGEDTCASIERALYNHELPPIPWAKVKKMLLDIRLPIQDVLVAGWMS